MKLELQGRELRNVDEDCPGIVVAIINPDVEVTWAVTGKVLPGTNDPNNPSGVVNVTGDEAESIDHESAQFSIEEMVEACEGEDGLYYLASTATMALIQTVSEFAPRGGFRVIRAFTDWCEETLIAVKERLTTEFNQ
jgi:hypothetical protein